MRRLLIRPGAIGDCILSLPALESLCAEFTEVWVPEPVVPLIRFAGSVRSIGSTGLNLLGIDGVEPPPPLIETLAAFDSVVSWYGTNRPEFRAAVARFPFRFFDALPPAEQCIWAADYYRAQAAEAGGHPIDPNPRIPVHAAPGDYAVIHPFSGSGAKNWPLDNYRRLAEWLSGRMPVRWCAGPEEPLPDAVRFDNLYQLAAWLAGARLYVGNDSGITHLAAAAGAPVVAIFGPTNPAVWAPRGPKVRTVHPARPAPIEQIASFQVVEAVESIL